MFKKSAADEIATAMANSLGLVSEAGLRDELNKAKTEQEVDAIVAKYKRSISTSQVDYEALANMAKSRIRKSKKK